MCIFEISIFANFILPALVSIITGMFLWQYISKPKLNFIFNNIGYAVLCPSDNADFKNPIAHITHSITISNDGRVPLKHVEICHVLDVSYDKKDFKLGNKNLIAVGILPDISYEFTDEGKAILFDSLAPGESVTIFYIYPPHLNSNGIHKFSSLGTPMIRSVQAIGKRISVSRNLNLPQWFNIFLLIMSIIGFWVFISFLAKLFILVNNYPF